MTSGSVFVACLRSVVEAASALGVDRDRLLRDADINPELMRMPTEIISVSRYLTLYRLAVERSGDPDFGLYVGHIMFVSSINLHLYMTAVCRSLREYFNMIPSTIRLRGDTGRVLVHPEGDFIRLEWHPLNDTIRRWRPLVDEMLKSSAEIVNAISALPVPVLGAELAYPAPDDTRGLKQAGHTVELLDLHASGFQPVMNLQEKRGFRPGSSPAGDECRSHHGFFAGGCQTGTAPAGKAGPCATIARICKGACRESD